MDLNRIQLTGRLDREPLLHDIGDHHVAALHLVCEHRWRTSSGTVESSSEHYRLTAWEELADQCGLHLHAGDYIYAAGRLRLFTSCLGGVEHTAHEIVLDRLILLAPAAPYDQNPHVIATIRGRSRTPLFPIAGFVPTRRPRRS